MKLSELKTMSLYEALEKLEEEKDQITTREALKHFAIDNIQNDRIFLAAHILSAINENYADYYDYDYCMGTLEKPTPLTSLQDLEDYCEFDEPDNTYKVEAHINSLNGGMDEITILEEKNDGRQTYYIVDYKGVKCTAIFNPFVCEYYADDKYGIVKEN